ncbi:4'-phosphopantetheinyl transferase family protein [Rhodopirellula sp. MGV]|uniref:4'-phosphopantetheinyl transferase family protein n=1 Tax=Rhodopirellula sp. MGV TaxID=2023130 RepID=UPI000B97147B|nr:4'-phosphopantetheinyl transferase superfamily protein [Rhodopirellula sp. MGV]OYP38383.1 hypothetical protein CGZ80_02230 [Rhodopirellula sp. MGV]PNY34194.1 phosphopantetheinyl transferase [Rhodopirellula baltica]
MSSLQQSESTDVTLDVWHAPADSERRGPFEKECEKCLAADELRDADRFRLVRSRNQHVVGRAMARRLLCTEEFAPQAIRFGIGAHGKPQVEYPESVRRPFNIAHTDGMVLCGVASEGVDSVGVDVESLHRRTTTEVADRYFALPEIEFLRTRPAEQQKFYFLKIWTLKEAFIKAIGTGLHTPLADFAFESIESDQPTIRFLDPKLDNGQTWLFVCKQPSEGFIASAAVATKKRSATASVTWNPFELFR